MRKRTKLKQKTKGEGRKICESVRKKRNMRRRGRRDERRKIEKRGGRRD